MNKILLFDSAMGTALIAAGQPAGTTSEEMNLTHPETVLEIHRENIRAGCDVITSNSFGVTPMIMRGEREMALKLLTESMKIAKQAASEKENILACLEIGPSGVLLGPYGDHSYEEVEEAFAAQAEAGSLAGADFIILETFADMEEIIRGAVAAGKASGLPVAGTMTFNEGGRSFMGASPGEFAGEAKRSGFVAVGSNCTLAPEEMIPIIEEILAEAGELPVIAQPNAGKPVFKDQKTVYEITPEEFASGAEKLIDLGISAIGGCCGTTPQMIGAVREIIDRRRK